MKTENIRKLKIELRENVSRRLGRVAGRILTRNSESIVFRLLSKESAADTFTYLNSDMREVLINALTDSEIKEVMDEMYLDDTVDVLEEMPANVVDRLLMVTDEETRKQINELLQ